MDATFVASLASNTTLTATLEQLSKHSGYDDYVLLALLALGGAGYLSRGILWNKPDPYHYKWFERPQELAGSRVNARKETRNIAQKLEETGRDLVIFWGSQSGTAEGFAHRLARDCHRRFKLDALVADLSDFDSESISLIPESKFAIFIISTYGEGDPSDNSADFLSWLKANKQISLKNLRYAAFGLGNSNYKFYNRVIDVVVEALDTFGASSLIPVARANEATNATEEDFLEWKENIFTLFRSQLGLTEHEPEYEPTIKIVEDESMTSIDLHLGEPISPKNGKKSSSSVTAIGALPIKDIRELTSNTSSVRNCVHLDLDLSEFPGIKYKTGDHLAVWPVNPRAEVNRILQVLGLQEKKDIPITILPLDPANNKLKIPTPTTIEALFQHYLEICAPVSRETLLALAQFAPSENIKTNLMALATDKAAYSAFISTKHITLARLLEYSISFDPSANWSQLPLAFVIESLQPMIPRYYSISSSSIISPRLASITVAVAPTPLIADPSVTISGLASTYISSFTSSQSVDLPLYASVNSTKSLHAHIRRSTFKLPASSTAPIIMVAAGTGIAPFRGFLQERARFASMGRPVGPMMLFFGCRNPEHDFLYDTEIQEIQSQLKESLEIVTAFSRVEGQKKVYVQDRVQEHSPSVSKLLLEDDASFYICGAAAMAREVGKVVGHFVKESKGWNEDDLAKWREERRRVRRWQEDVWG